MTPDYSHFLIQAEKKLAKVYPLMCDRKAAKAILAALEVQRELDDFVAHVVRMHAK